jgi:hypothetical protein
VTVAPVGTQPKDIVSELAEWIFKQGRHKTKDDLLEDAKSTELEFTTEKFTEAYQRVYETKQGRPPATGWPYKSEFQIRAGGSERA